MTSLRPGKVPAPNTRRSPKDAVIQLCSTVGWIFQAILVPDSNSKGSSLGKSQIQVVFPIMKSGSNKNWGSFLWRLKAKVADVIFWYIKGRAPLNIGITFRYFEWVFQLSTVNPLDPSLMHTSNTAKLQVEQNPMTTDFSRLDHCSPSRGPCFTEEVLEDVLMLEFEDHVAVFPLGCSWKCDPFHQLRNIQLDHRTWTFLWYRTMWSELNPLTMGFLIQNISVSSVPFCSTISRWNAGFHPKKSCNSTVYARVCTIYSQGAS